jgi:hypothetical protein
MHDVTLPRVHRNAFGRPLGAPVCGVLEARQVEVNDQDMMDWMLKNFDGAPMNEAEKGFVIDISRKLFCNLLPGQQTKLRQIYQRVQNELNGKDEE